MNKDELILLVEKMGKASMSVVVAASGLRRKEDVDLAFSNYEAAKKHVIDAIKELP